ncbi:MAG: sn-glycerol-3-phosphate ABC transporter ATP-binding protein UgpC [Pseudomonadota bacterium]
MAAVQIKGVEKYFGSNHIIRGVDIEIEDGAFAVLVGPSGCGKSTLLRMIAGLEEITAGEIHIGGTLVNDVSPKDRDIAMVFQNYALYPHMTVFDNMAFSLKLAKVEQSGIRERVNKAAEILSLAPLLNRYPRELSGGQQQRVAMGRAIVRDPRAFLFDEPLSNLDAKLRVQMRTEIKELHQRLKTTSIFVTHDQIEAMTMADQLVVMRDGIVEQCGRPLDIYDHPANMFIASFIGSPAMNFIPGTLRISQGVKRVEFETGITLPAPLSALGSDGQRVIYGIRPEHLRLADNEQGLKCMITVIEPTGAATQVTTKFGEINVVNVFRERRDFVLGNTIFLETDYTKAHLFCEASGKTLMQ